MKHDGRAWRLLEKPVQFITTGDQRVEFNLQLLRGEAIPNCLDDLVTALLELVAFSLPQMERRVALRTQPIHMLGIFLAEFLAQFRSHQIGPERIQHSLFEHILTDAQAIAAGALVHCRGATVARLAGLGEAAPALSALEHERQQIGRTTLGPELLGTGMAHQFLASLHAVPQILFDDPKLRNLVDDPLFGRIGPRQTHTGIGVFHLARLVPDTAANVDFIVEDAGSTLHVAVERGLRPTLARRVRHLLPIEHGGYALRATARRIFFEDAHNDSRLLFINLEFADRLDAIAKRQSATGLAVFDTTAQTAPCLDGEVFQEQRVHRALEADMQLGNLAFGNRVDAHACEQEALADRGDIGLIARHAVERFGHDDIEPSGLGILQHHLHGWTDHARATHGMIGIDAAIDNIPTLTLRQFLCAANLILDG